MVPGKMSNFEPLGGFEPPTYSFIDASLSRKILLGRIRLYLEHIQTLDVAPLVSRSPLIGHGLDLDSGV